MLIAVLIATVAVIAAGFWYVLRKPSPSKYMALVPGGSISFTHHGVEHIFVLSDVRRTKDHVALFFQDDTGAINPFTNPDVGFRGNAWWIEFNLLDSRSRVSLDGGVPSIPGAPNNALGAGTFYMKGSSDGGYTMEHQASVKVFYDAPVEQSAAVAS